MRRLALSAAVVAAMAFALAPSAVAGGPANTYVRTDADALIAFGSGGWSGWSQSTDTVAGMGDDQWQTTVTKASTLTVSVADSFIVGDNYAVSVDGKSIGTTPPEPLYGSTYSSGSFSTKLNPGTHTVTVQDVGGIKYYKQGDTFMIPAGYYVSLALGKVGYVPGSGACSCVQYVQNVLGIFLGPDAKGAGAYLAAAGHYQYAPSYSGAHPETGDIVVLQPGFAGADSVSGHIAFVADWQVSSEGDITITMKSANWDSNKLSTDGGCTNVSTVRIPASAFYNDPGGIAFYRR